MQPSVIPTHKNLMNPQHPTAPICPTGAEFPNTNPRMKSNNKVPTMCLPKTASKFMMAAFLAAASLAPSAFAASQTWTNAPVDNTWTNINNWVGRAVPGALNSAGANADTATFNTAIPLSGIGGAGSPITNDLTRGIRFLLFDTASCGAYVFGNAAVVDNWLEIMNSGNISMNATVANPINFNAPLRFRIPGSTNGRYDLTNNAASSTATLYIGTITNTSASTRPLSMFLGGSNTGTNTVARFDDQAAGSGAILLDKVGAGTWIFSGPNDLPQKTSAGNIAHVFVNQGLLIVKAAGSLGTITVGNLVVTNSTLQINGVTLNNGGITVRNGGTVQMNGSGTVNGISVANQASTSVTLATTSGGDVMTIGIAANQPTGGAADTVMHVAGPGTVNLSQSANYVGKWSVDAGTLQLNNLAGLGTGSSLNIAAGGTFDVSPITAGSATYTLGTAGISGSGAATAATIRADASGIVDLATGPKTISLTYTPTTFTGDALRPALTISQGTLSVGGNTFNINNASGTALSDGTYVIIQQASGSITSAGNFAVNVTGSGLAAGRVASITVTAGNLNLVVAAYVPKNLVWTGGALNFNWNIATDANWLNGALVSVFNNSDTVTFNSVGSTNATATLVGTLSPGSVTVDTSANNYTLSGSGSIAGSASLTKKSSGTLVLSTVNSYSGGTVVSNGTLQVGVANALPTAGSGDVAVYSPGTLDLNGLSDTINALNGDGTVDNVVGGAGSLTVGNNNNNGTFTGVLKNTAGTLALVKEGSGSQTLTAANTYTGTTTLGHGTLVAANEHALGTVSDVSVNNGTLNMQTNLYVNSLAGGGGVIANNSTTTTNTLIVQGATTTSYAGSIVNGSGGGGIAVKVLGGTLRLNSGNSYTGGTIVGSGATFQIGGGIGFGVTGDLIATNTATLGLPGGSNPPGTPVSITTVEPGSVTFTSAAEGNSWGSQFIGGTAATNRFIGPVSVGGATSFANFLGVVQFAMASGNFRFFNAGGVAGGDNTSFEFVTGNVHTRDTQVVRLGAISGGSRTSGIGGPGSAGQQPTWVIGSKNVNNSFEGYISGTNNLVKLGTASLTFDGVNTTTNTDNLSYTNYLYSQLINYNGNTTISNGTFALVVPNNLSNSPSITLAAATAVLDATKMGFIQDQVDISLVVTNQILVTNGVFELFTGQTLTSKGTIIGTVQADAGSTVNPGGSIGTMSVTGPFTSSANINVEWNRTNAPISDLITATGNITINGGNLVVTNLGPDLVTGDVFTLFNKGIVGSGFASIVLPAQNVANTITYVYETNLVTAGSSPAGTIKVLSGASSIANYSTNITATVNGSTITVAWPATHIGWELAIQTNTISVGLANNWVTNFGTASVTSTNFPIDPSNGSVFYRLVHP